MYLYDYIQDISSYFVENQVEMESKFYTDDILFIAIFLPLSVESLSLQFTTQKTIPQSIK